MDDFFDKVIFSVFFLLFFIGTFSIIFSIFFEKHIPIRYMPSVKKRKRDSSMNFDDNFDNLFNE